MIKVKKKAKSFTDLAIKQFLITRCVGCFIGAEKYISGKHDL